MAANPRPGSDPSPAIGNLALERTIVERLHRKAGAARWSLSTEAFALALEASVRKAFASGSADARQLKRYLNSLHLEDLALACACAQGSEPAWEHFIREHRPGLHRAADAIDPSGGSRDLADSLYGELFGLDVRDGERRSHFRYFHGRSSLATWLRAVLSQRHVDRIRSARRQTPLPDDEAPGAIAAPRDKADPDWQGYVELMRRSVSAAVAELEPRDRLRLRCYFAQDLTLAQIGRMLKESEATASRHLSRVKRDIRAAVERDLRARRLSDPEIVECFAAVVSDPAYLDLAELVGSEIGTEMGSEMGTRVASDPRSDSAGMGSDPRRKNARSNRSEGKERSRAGQR
jgi:RNA polymerase sigma-70 factor